MKPLNVLLVPPEPWSPRRKAWVPGASPSEEELDRLFLEQHGIRIELIDSHGLPFNPAANMHPIYRGLDPLRSAQLLAGRRSVDLVMSVFESSVLIPLLMRRIVGFKPKIAMWDIVPEETWKMRSRFQDVVVPRVDHIFLLAGAQRDYLQRRWQAAGKASVVWQHVDTGFFQPEAFHPKGPILAIGEDVGRDWTTFLRAISDLDIDVIIKTRRALDLSGVRRARVRQVRDKLSFVALRDLYAQSRFVVVPVHETLNVSGVGSVLEAMAMGKALVLSGSANMLDYVEAGTTALTVPVGDAAALRAAISSLATSDERVQSMGAAARERAVRLYSRSAFVSRMATQIRALVGNGTA